MHRYIKNGIYPVDWAVQDEFDGEMFGELPRGHKNVPTDTEMFLTMKDEK